MKEFISLTDVKINNDYEHIKTIAPTVAEKEPLYLNGERWLNTTDGLSYELQDQVAGTWIQIEQNYDTKINRVKENTFLTVIRDLSNYFIVNRNGDFSENYETQDLPDFFTRENIYQLFQFESVWSDFTFDSAGKTITVGNDLLGSLTNSFKIGDCLLISGSRRNDGYYSIANVTSTVITVNEDLVDGSANCFSFLTDVPDALIEIVGRMIHYDIYVRSNRAGLKSERVGTYSYTLGDSGNNLGYPYDIVSGLNAYEMIPIGGLSVFIN